MPLKVTTWNVKHADRLLGDNPSPNVLDRRRRVRDTIEEIDPDILCIQEGPKGEEGITEFCRTVLGDRWLPVLLRQPGDDLGARDSDYQLKGTQWIWYLVKPEILDRCRLQRPEVWQEFTGGSKTWPVHYWGDLKSSRHPHYRHPQVLVYDVGNGEELEIIGVHLKSKINRKKIERDANGDLLDPYVTEATKARIKLATEARNIRDYIGAKFDQVEHPGILVLGDCNDGPGHDLFEEKYLFFDLISNLQGEVLMAERFFNHALFDAPAHLRWTAKYRNAVAKPPIKAKDNPLLLDHILMSQPLCRGNLSLKVNEKAGSVEHEAFMRANAGSNSKTISSDHRPVSCVLDDNP